MSTVNLRRVITKVLVSIAIAVGAVMEGAALASADTNSTGVDQNAFSTLSCGCRETTPAGSPARKEEIERGIQKGVSAWSPGAPAPAPPG
jgi:hypothetical protein